MSSVADSAGAGRGVVTSDWFRSPLSRIIRWRAIMTERAGSGNPPSDDRRWGIIARSVTITINGHAGPATIQVQDGALFLPTPDPVPVASQCFGVPTTVGAGDDSLCLGSTGSNT